MSGSDNRAKVKTQEQVQDKVQKAIQGKQGEKLEDHTGKGTLMAVHTSGIEKAVAPFLRSACTVS